ncbi:hypothetical protein HY411_00670 [Candidatus Gottesmanbacteria bacterium]|nr:hypothetical protein [Candidatus Gottesmanbacteria bacterium]
MTETALTDVPVTYSSTQSERGGSLTVEYNPRDVLANTIGHVLAIADTHLQYLTLNHVFENASPDLAKDMFNRWKDVPWRGDIKVRIGHSSLWDELGRTFSLDAAEGRPNLFTRVIGLPWTGLSWVESKLFRHNYFNPFTNAATVYHPHEAFGMHELGRAQFYDEHKHSVYLRVLGALTLLPVASFFEWKSSANAMKRFESDVQRERATKILEPRFGGTLMSELFLPANLLFPGLSTLVSPLMNWAGGLISGHILSRLPNKRERFGWVFGNDSQPPPSAAHLAPAMV